MTARQVQLPEVWNAESLFICPLGKVNDDLPNLCNYMAHAVCFWHTIHINTR